MRCFASSDQYSAIWKSSGFAIAARISGATCVKSSAVARVLATPCSASARAAVRLLSVTSRTTQITPTDSSARRIGW
jgi:hypothetical protein